MNSQQIVAWLVVAVGIVTGIGVWKPERFRWPFRLRYWLVFHNGHRRLMVIRQRFAPTADSWLASIGLIAIDGPFDTNEDAAQSLAFWSANYERASQLTTGDKQ